MNRCEHTASILFSSHPSNMKSPLSVPLIAVGVLLFTDVPLKAQPSSGAATASQLQAWDWIDDKENKAKSAAEVFAHYESHREAFASAPVAKDRSYCRAAYRVASAAFELKKPEFESLLKMAEEIADRDSVTRVFSVARPAVLAHSEFLRPLVNLGEYEMALALVERAELRRKKYLAALPRGTSPMLNDSYSMEETMILRDLMKSIGDYEGLEKQIRAEMAEKEKDGRKLLDQVKKAGGGKEPGLPTLGDLSALTGFMSKMMIPELAETVAKQGRIAEAEKMLGEYRSTKKSSKKGVAGMVTGMLGGAIDAKDGLSEAEVYLMAGRPKEALDVLEKAAKGQKNFVGWIGGVNKGQPNPLTAYEKVSSAKLYNTRTKCLWALGRFAEALEAQENMLQRMNDLAPTHPDVISARQMRAWALLANGKGKDAHSEVETIAADQLKTVDNLLRFASVRQRMVYLQQADPFSLLVTTGDKERLADAVLRLKGVVLDSMLEEQRLARGNGDKEAQALLTKLTDLRRNFDDASAGSEGDAAALSQEIEKTESKLASLTAATLTARGALSVTQEQVKAALGAGDALLEFVRYRQLSKAGKWSSQYGALVLRSGRETAWTPVGDAADVDQSIHALLDLLSGRSESKGDAKLERDLKKLHSLLLQPLAEATGDARRLIIAPDGDLGLLSFATLIAPDGRFVSEACEIAYVSNARDLLRTDSAPETAAAQMVIIANPDYDMTGQEIAAHGLSRGAFTAFDRSSLPKLDRLDGTAAEMKQIGDVATAAGIATTSFAERDAREEVLRSLKSSPRFLHLATHGFVLSPAGAVRAAGRGDSAGGLQESAFAMAGRTGSVAVADNPLQRSVLALAGANVTFDKWRSGVTPPAASDGVLTAAEVATLDLSKTWLAVLSACETAAGETLSGEGVMGMRRGFFLAGVDHLVMTFWPIADAETVQVMTDFYRAVGQKIHPATALHQVQRDALVKWRKEQGLLKAVFFAGPFALSTTGKLPPP